MPRFSDRKAERLAAIARMRAQAEAHIRGERAAQAPAHIRAVLGCGHADVILAGADPARHVCAQCRVKAQLADRKQA